MQSVDVEVPPLRCEVHGGRVVPSYPERPANVTGLLSAALARAPSRVAVVDGDSRISYAELHQLVLRSAARLAALGVAPGDRVGVMLDNRIDVLAAVLGIAALGAISVPMNIRQRPPETAHALNNAGVKVMVCEASLSANLPDSQEAPSLVHVLFVDDDRPLWDGAEALDLAAVNAGEDQPFCILYTSGTTGRPKGAILTHFGLVTSCLGAVEHQGLRDGDCTILSVPASHVTGLVLALLTSLTVAGKVVLQRGFKARRFLELAAAERLNYVVLVPAMYSLCLLDEDYDRFDLSSWRVGGYGGAPMPEAVVEALARKHPSMRLVNIYGSTETTSPAVMMPDGEAAARRTQLGRPLRYADIRIMDAQGREQPRGEQGEIWIAGPMVIPGYWNNPEATADAFVGGYWKSGDIGVMDGEGYLKILDRKKDMINRGGFKVYSVEVENVLMSHPAVIEAGVVGRPCPVLGERVEAFVVTAFPVAGEELVRFCAARLSDYKVPEHVVLKSAPLPRNANGKLLKNELRSWLS
jgi:long-chain acyl-CoA synthetase